MTQQERENKIKELKKQIKELKMAKIEEPQTKRWKPNKNEKYCVVGANGNFGNVLYDNDVYDDWNYLIGNCFKTKEEAEEYKKQIEYTARYKNYIEEHSEPLNWSDDNQEKWYVFFSFYTNSIAINYNVLEKVQGVIYASSKQIILDAINEIGEDNFKKYVLGVMSADGKQTFISGM